MWPTVRPNFHWGYRESGHAWADAPDASPAGTRAYVDYWIERTAANDLRRVQRDAWEHELERLHRDGIADLEAHRSDFSAAFQGRMDFADPRPGIRCELRMPLSEARSLDADGRLVPTIRARTNEILRVLGEPEL